jgi:hypothetical protein
MSAAMTKLCATKTCRKPLERRPTETPTEFRRRSYCERACFLRNANAHRIYAKTRKTLPPKPCANPQCGKMMHQAETEGPKKFGERKYCSVSCGTLATNVMRFKEAREAQERRKKQKDSPNLWQQHAYAHFKNGEPRTVLHPEIKTVEEFIARVGITKVPPAYCAVVTGATPIRREP